MKKMKKIVSMLLAMVMMFALAATALAADGQITINNTVAGKTYTIYRIFDLESYNDADNAYAYTVAEKWTGFMEQDGIVGTYVTIENGYVKWVEDASAAEFAAKAIAYAKANKIEEDGSDTAGKADNGSGLPVKFTNLPLGYYLVDSSVGILCGLTTTNPTATINEKNGAPSVEKQVKEGETWGESNDVEIGDTVDFKITVKAKAGAEIYVLHDKMSAGLTLVEDTIVVEGLTEGTDYTVTISATDGCTFEIAFTESYLKTITGDTDIVVTYSAILNENATTGETANTNETKLEYGDKNYTESDTTDTKTFQFDLVKTDASDEKLDGAEFELYDAMTGGNKITLVKTADNMYRVATEDEITNNVSEDGEVTTVIKAGTATIKGLDSKTYWLQETEAPAGYNKLTDRVEVVIDGANRVAEPTETTDEDGNTITIPYGDGVQVINNTGTILPSTGGMGTTVIYLAGGILVLAAVVLLFVKRRMSKEV